LLLQLCDRLLRAARGHRRQNDRRNGWAAAGLGGALLAKHRQLRLKLRDLTLQLCNLLLSSMSGAKETTGSKPSEGGECKKCSVGGARVVRREIGARNREQHGRECDGRKTSDNHGRCWKCRKV